MIKVIAKMIIKEGMEKELMNSIQELVAETRKETGCIVYQLFQDTDNPKAFIFVEEWECKEALDRHMNAKHFKEAAPKLTEILEKDMEISVATLVI